MMYLLTMVGRFDHEEIQVYVKGLNSIVTSPRANYDLHDGVCFVTFESNHNQLEIHDFLVEHSYGLCSVFLLAEVSDKVSMHIPSENAQHLFGLFDTTPNTDDPDEEEDEEDYEELQDELDKNSSVTDDLLQERRFKKIMDFLKSEIRKPGLDELLDKINEKGFESLSQFEKDSLAEYSN